MDLKRYGRIESNCIRHGQNGLMGPSGIDSNRRWEGAISMNVVALRADRRKAQYILLNECVPEVSMGEQGRHEAPTHLIHSPDPYAERFRFCFN